MRRYLHSVLIISIKAGLNRVERMTVFFQRLSINDIASLLFFSLPQMYYFVETLAASAIVSLYTAPPKLRNCACLEADAAHSRRLIHTHQAIHRSLIVVNPNIDPFSGSGLVFSILLHYLVWAAAIFRFLFLFFAGIYHFVIRNQRL